MKKGILLLIVLMLAPGGFALAQETAPSYRERITAQQSFAGEYIEAHPVPDGFATPDAIDAYYQAVVTAWLNQRGEADPVFQRLGSYIYQLLLVSIAKSQAPEWAVCHVWATYMVPAFLEDFAFFSDAPTSEKAFLIRRSTLFTVYNSRAFQCALPGTTWTTYRDAFTRLPAVIDTYLDTGAYADENVAKTLRAIKRLVNMAPYVALQDAIYNEQHDAAFAGLAAAFAEQRSLLYLLPLGRNLAQAYADAGQTTRALAVLDLLIRSTTPGDLPRDTLRHWYARTDPERGPARFRLLAATAGLPALMASEDRVDLKGRYLNLATGQPFDLASLNGKLVLLDFWATWCGPCIAEFPILNALHDQYGDDFVLVGIAGDAIVGDASASEVSAFVAEHGLRYLTLYDDPAQSLVKQFNVPSLGWPRKFFINEEGLVMTHPTDTKRRYVELDEARAYLEHLHQ